MPGIERRHPMLARYTYPTLPRSGPSGRPGLTLDVVDRSMPCVGALQTSSRSTRLSGISLVKVFHVGSVDDYARISYVMGPHVCTGIEGVQKKSTISNKKINKNEEKVLRIILH